VKEHHRPTQFGAATDGFANPVGCSRSGVGRVRGTILDPGDQPDQQIKLPRMPFFARLLDG
jgi:hypothetical protein